MPAMLGAISDNTRSTLEPPTAARTSFNTASSRKSPSTKSTPGIASMGNMSVATIRLVPPTIRAAYWLHPPGAAPKSTHRMPGRSSRSVSWISLSLNTARDRQPSRCARLTNSSFACSASHRALLLVRLGITWDARGIPWDVWAFGHYFVLVAPYNAPDASFRKTKETFAALGASLEPHRHDRQRRTHRRRGQRIGSRAR